MENEHRKVNFPGGKPFQTKEGAREPYKKEIFLKFVDWCSLTRSEKARLGIPNARAFALRNRLHESQLSRWMQRKDFETLKIERMRERWSDFLPEAIDALRRRIKKYGMARDVGFWLELAGWDRKKAVEHKVEPTFSQDDLRALIAYLPKQEQLVFNQTIAKLLLKAREAAEADLKG